MLATSPANPKHNPNKVLTSSKERECIIPTDDEIWAAIISRNKRPPKPTLYEKLLRRAKDTYPFPPQPFCPNTISVNVVRQALEDAGYRDFTLFIAEQGIFIERKRKDNT